MTDPLYDNLLARWHHLARSAGWRADAAAAVGEELLRLWGEPSRAYHNRQHLLECLTELEAALADERDPASVEDRSAVATAVWFHDAIYDARRADNESASADLAADRLATLGADPAFADRVRQLVLDTAHRAEPATPDGRLIVDIDLSILGKNPTRFDNYNGAIRSEYAHVPEPAYEAGRLAVLKAFLDRPTIYRTARFVNLYERQARLNLARAIERLSGGGTA